MAQGESWTPGMTGKNWGKRAATNQGEFKEVAKEEEPFDYPTFQADLQASLKGARSPRIIPGQQLALELGGDFSEIPSESQDGYSHKQAVIAFAFAPFPVPYAWRFYILQAITDSWQPDDAVDPYSVAEARAAEAAAGEFSPEDNTFRAFYAALRDDDELAEYFQALVDTELAPEVELSDKLAFHNMFPELASAQGDKSQ